jgi:hypothetical protein
VGANLQELYGTEDPPPRDAADWIEATREGLVSTHGRKATVEDRCAASDGDHRFTAADGTHSQPTSA